MKPLWLKFFDTNKPLTLKELEIIGKLLAVMLIHTLIVTQIIKDIHQGVRTACAIIDA